MFEKLKEYGLYIILGLIALGALAYAYVQTSNSQKGAEIESANFDALIVSQSKSDKLKKSSTVADDLLAANGGKTIGKYRIDSNKVSYVIGETYSDIFDNKRMLDISSDLSDIEEGQLRTVLIAQPAISVNGDDTINTVNLNSDKSLTVGTNTISQENLDEVADELKGYNVGAIGFATFENEQEAKDFRDTYFSSYEVYEIGNTGNFIVLKEYNQGGESTSIQGKVATQSNLEGLGNQEENSNDTCNENLCLDENLVTIKAKNSTSCGQEYEFQGNTYYVACNKNDLKTKIFNESYPANRIVTSKLTDMSNLFNKEETFNFNTRYLCKECNVYFSGNLSAPEYLNCRPNNDRTSYHNLCGQFEEEDMMCEMYREMGEEIPEWMECKEENTFNLDISNWDTSNVTTMEGMFYNASSFNQDISNWNTSKVTNMVGMFDGAKEFNQDISNWDTHNVTNMMGMFQGAAKFNQPIGNWNINNVTNLRFFMSSYDSFDNIMSFNQDLSNWNTTNVTDMSFLFCGDTRTRSLTNTVNIKNWNTSNVTNMSGIFSSCIKYDEDLSSWNTSNVIYMNYMFKTAEIFNNGGSNGINGWNTSKVKDMRGLFNGAKEFNQPVNGWNTSNVENMNTTFWGNIKFNQPLDNWDTSKVTSMRYTFARNKSFVQDISGWNVSHVTDHDNFDSGTSASWTSSMKPTF